MDFSVFADCSYFPKRLVTTFLGFLAPKFQNFFEIRVFNLSFEEVTTLVHSRFPAIRKIAYEHPITEEPLCMLTVEPMTDPFAGAVNKGLLSALRMKQF